MPPSPGIGSKRRNLLLFFVASLIVALAIVFGPQTVRYISSTTSWSMAKAKWDQSVITHYQFSLFLSSIYCGVSSGGITEVIDGHSNYDRCIGGQDTVETFFVIARQCAFDFWNTCQVDYDPEYGYPKEIYSPVGWIRITEFQRLGSTQ